MGTVNLKTASGGSVILSPANTAVDVTVTVPASTGTMALQSDVIGLNQTWQALTVGTQRLANTNYTNSSGKPIAVSIYASSDGGTNAIILVGGVVAFKTVNGYTGALTAIVPNNAVYSLNIGTGTLYGWSELR